MRRDKVRRIVSEGMPHSNHSTANLLVICTTNPPVPTLSPSASLPRCLTSSCQPIRLKQKGKTHFHSVSLTSRSKFSSKSSCAVPHHPNTRPLTYIKKPPPSGFLSLRCAAHGGLSLIPAHFSGPGSPQTSTCFGLTSCKSGPGPCCLMFTFASVGSTSMIGK